jgi:predicted metal-dependent hydrolase
MEKIKIEEIEAFIERKRIRNIYISINSSSGEARISAPVKTALNVIETFFASKLAWIRRHKAKISAKPPKIHNNYSTGEKVEVLGKKYALKVFDYDKEPKVFLNFDSLDMYIRPNAGAQERKEAMNAFYARQLEKIVPRMILKWEEKLGIYAEPNAFKFLLKNIQGMLGRAEREIDKEAVLLRNPVKIAYKKMKGKWGVCHVHDKKITLNTELAKKSARCVEYVAVHELLHLKERKHNKRFKDYMKKAFPDWKKLEAELEGYI